MLIYLQLIETVEEQSKFMTLYSEYRELMFRVAFTFLRNSEDSEDVVHHAFVKIAENIKIVEPVSPKTKQFVVTIIENRAKDILRMRGKHPEVMLDESIYSAEDVLAEDDFLAGCISKLTDQQREVIWLKFHYGYDLREIAKMLGITLSWARKIDQRAKKKLEEMLKEGGWLND